MKRAIVVLGFIFFAFAPFNHALSQCCPYLDSFYFIPQNPGPTDSVYLHATVTTPQLGHFISYDAQIAENLITINACYYAGMPTSLETHEDSLFIGLLESGIYEVNFVAHQSATPENCSYQDSNSILLNLEVLTPNSIVEKNIQADVDCFPNPLGDQQLHLRSKLPIYEIEFYDALGQRLLHFRDVNASSYAIDVSNLAGGLYIIKGQNVEGQNFARKILKN